MYVLFIKIKFILVLIIIIIIKSIIIIIISIVIILPFSWVLARNTSKDRMCIL